MDELKPETIKIVTPNPTNFRYSYLVTPDEYKGVRKYKAECLIKKPNQGKKHGRSQARDY